MAKKKIEIIPSYELSKTVKKVIYQMIIVAIVAIGAYLVDDGIPELTLEYPQYAGIFAIVTAGIVGFLNWYKHKDDIKEVPV